SDALDMKSATEIVEAHKAAIRNAWLSAKDPSKREAAVQHALASVGISMPKPDASARIYQQLEETTNIEAWIQSCRSGRNLKTAECATDAGIAEAKKDAEQNAKATYHEDDGKKQGKAMPMQ